MLSRTVQVLHKAEEGLLAFLLAAMVLVTFTQVVARYFFNSGWIAALELTTYLFAWLVILGISYGIRVHSHIGVDVIVKLFPNTVQRILGIVAVSAGFLYAALLLYGGYAQISEVLYPFGIEVEDIPMPFAEEEGEKMPLWVPYSVLLIGFSLMIYRLLVVLWQIATGKATGLMLGDEVREAMDAYKDADGDGATAPESGDREGTK